SSSVGAIPRQADLAGTPTRLTTSPSLIGSSKGLAPSSLSQSTIAPAPCATPLRSKSFRSVKLRRWQRTSLSVLCTVRGALRVEGRHDRPARTAESAPRHGEKGVGPSPRPSGRRGPHLGTGYGYAQLCQSDPRDNGQRPRGGLLVEDRRLARRRSAFV